MKKIFAICLLISIFCVGCGQSVVSAEKDVFVSPMVEIFSEDVVVPSIVETPTVDTTVVETPVVDTSVVDTTVVDTTVVDISTIDTVMDFDIFDVDSFISYLKSMYPDLTFDMRYFEENYFDDYFNRDIQQYAYIAGMNNSNFEEISFNIAFVDNKVYDFSMAVNTNFSEEYLVPMMEMGKAFGMSEKEISDMLYKLSDFSLYEKNEYGNPQTYFTSTNAVGGCVVFEGGKDFEFNGVTYYFVMTSVE